MQGEHTHEIIKCSCGTLIAQCRCMAQKSVRTIPNGCSKCKGGHQNQTPQSQYDKKKQEIEEREDAVYKKREKEMLSDFTDTPQQCCEKCKCNKNEPEVCDHCQGVCDCTPQPQSDEAIVRELHTVLPVDLEGREEVIKSVEQHLTRKNKEKEEARREERERIVRLIGCPSCECSSTQLKLIKAIRSQNET